MKQSQRKFLGVFLTISSVLAYAVVAVAIYLTVLVGQPNWLLLLYFAVAGIGWLLPAMAIIRWMARPDA